MCTGRVIGSPAAMRMEPPLDAPQTDDEGCTSLQPLGDASALVSFDMTPHGLPEIDGAYIGGEFVEAQEFSQRRLSAWHEAICAELQASREESEHAQAWIDSQAGEL